MWWTPDLTELFLTTGFGGASDEEMTGIVEILDAVYSQEISCDIGEELMKDMKEKHNRPAYDYLIQGIRVFASMSREEIDQVVYTCVRAREARLN